MHDEPLRKLIGDEYDKSRKPESVQRLGVGMNCEKKLATFENSPKNAMHPVATSNPPATNSIGPRNRLIRFIAASEKLIAAAAIKNGIASPSE
jgi:hypothetical protein